MLYPIQCIAVVEGAYECIQYVLNAFSLPEQHADFVGKVKLLVVSSNIERYYKMFHKKVMNLVAPRVEGDYSSGEPFEALIAEVTNYKPNLIVLTQKRLTLYFTILRIN